ncbi:aminotransferase class V-fold PLP-dependent enzyme [Candidatus Nanosalina sp. VS9-1]|uniref:aminotransferase class V-fold PLP-dependent enzyme n=1 Tax=Candidatus Nanosalina sp. VS9-1 TaxID=3388566 RepID=UPI0039DF5A1C
MYREDFPLPDVTYLDSACMSLRPEKVIEKVNRYYREYPGCSGRSSHSISQKASKELEQARRKVANFIDASRGELMFTSGTTEGINTVARGLDVERVFLTEREHNSNRAVWQELGVETVNMEGLDTDFLESELREGDLLSVLHVSNLDGKVFDVEEACRIADEQGAYSLIDAAQSIPHRPFSVQSIEPDFVAFSGHKMLGPSGTGGLYVAKKVQEDLSPLKYGGGAVENSSFSGNERKSFPQGFEPGLKNIAGFTGLGAAVEYLEDIGMEKIQRHEEKLTDEIVRGLEEADVKVFCEGPGIVSVAFNSVTHGEAAQYLDRRDIKVRAGRHCVHPWFNDRNFDGTVRASLHLYNTEEDVEKFVKEVRKLSRL